MLTFIIFQLCLSLGHNCFKIMGFTTLFCTIILQQFFKKRMICLFIEFLQHLVCFWLDANIQILQCLYIYYFYFSLSDFQYRKWWAIVVTWASLPLLNFQFIWFFTAAVGHCFTESSVDMSIMSSCIYPLVLLPWKTKCWKKIFSGASSSLRGTLVLLIN